MPEEGEEAKAWSIHLWHPWHCTGHSWRGAGTCACTRGGLRARDASEEVTRRFAPLHRAPSYPIRVSGLSLWLTRCPTSVALTTSSSAPRFSSRPACTASQLPDLSRLRVCGLAMWPREALHSTHCAAAASGYESFIHCTSLQLARDAGDFRCSSSTASYFHSMRNSEPGNSLHPILCTERAKLELRMQVGRPDFRLIRSAQPKAQPGSGRRAKLRLRRNAGDGPYPPHPETWNPPEGPFQWNIVFQEPSVRIWVSLQAPSLLEPRRSSNSSSPRRRWKILLGCWSLGSNRRSSLRRPGLACL